MRARRLARWVAALAASATAALVVAPAASAATFPVVSTADSGEGTLRQAILDANAQGGDDVIDATGVTGTISLQTELPGLAEDIEIEGSGADQLTVRRTGDVAYRIFTVPLGVTATISAMTMADGWQSEPGSAGGAVSNAGTLTLDSVVITESSALQHGGGIVNLGTGNLTVLESSVVGNAAQVGAGIANRPSGSLTVQDSTVQGNTGLSGAGISNAGTATISRSTISGNTLLPGDVEGGGIANTGVMTVANSTIAGNTGAVRGGGIVNNDSAQLVITNSTIAANGAADGANIFQGSSGDPAPLQLSSTVLAEPVGSANCATGGGSVIASSDFNIADDASCDLDQASDQPSTDPDLGPLQDNGGPTPTMLPGPASAALDAGFANGFVLAQRGEDRTRDLFAISQPPGGDSTDVGAVELAPEEIPPPQAAITGGPAGPTTDAQPTFTFDTQNALTVECSLEQGEAAFGPCSGEGQHTPPAPLPDGEYVFIVRATAADGETSTDQRGFTLDTVAPATPDLAGTNPISPSSDGTPAVIGNVDFDTATVKLYVNDAMCVDPPEAEGPGSELGGDGIPVPVPENATAEITARAVDAAGNTSSCSPPISYTEDSTAPAVQIKRIRINHAKRKAKVSFTAQDTVTPTSAIRFECKLDRKPFASCTSPKVYKRLKPGKHRVRVRATDQAGNTGVAGKRFRVRAAG